MVRGPIDAPPRERKTRSPAIWRAGLRFWWIIHRPILDRASFQLCRYEASLRRTASDRRQAPRHSIIGGVMPAHPPARLRPAILGPRRRSSQACRPPRAVL